jgi:hypothetical protein
MADAATVAAAAIADVVMAAMAATSADAVATAGSNFAAAAVAVDDFLVAASWAAVGAAAARAWPLGLRQDLCLFTQATILSLSCSYLHVLAECLLLHPLARGLKPGSCTLIGVGTTSGIVVEGQLKKLGCSMPLRISRVSFSQPPVAAHF